MTENHNKIERLDLSKWVVTRYFHYRSSVRERFGEYDDFWSVPAAGDEYVKDLFKHFHSVYLAIRHLRPYSPPDNKVVIEITNVDTRETLYLGMYDGVYSIGKSYWSEFGSVTEITTKDTHEKKDETLQDKGE